jgi:hypothetical protein
MPRNGKSSGPGRSYIGAIGFLYRLPQRAARRLRPDTRGRRNQAARFLYLLLACRRAGRTEREPSARSIQVRNPWANHSRRGGAIQSCWVCWSRAASIRHILTECDEGQASLLKITMISKSRIACPWWGRQMPMANLTKRRDTSVLKFFQIAAAVQREMEMQRCLWRRKHHDAHPPASETVPRRTLEKL